MFTSWSNSNLLCDRPIIKMTLTMYGGGKDGSSITGNSTRLKLNKNRKKLLSTTKCKHFIKFIIMCHFKPQFI